MSACPALPASRIRGDAPPKRAFPTSVTGVSISRTNSMPPTLAQLRQRPEAGLHRREGGEQGGDDVVADPVPLVDELEPGVAVPGVVLVHQPRGRSRSRCSIAHLPSGKRVTEHRRGVPPDQTVLLEPEGLDRPGGRGQRVERAERVVDEALVDLCVAADRTTDGRAAPRGPAPTSRRRPGSWRRRGRSARRRRRPRRESRVSTPGSCQRATRAWWRCCGAPRRGR